MIVCLLFISVQMLQALYGSNVRIASRSPTVMAGTNLKKPDLVINALSQEQQRVSNTRADEGASLTNYMRLPVEQYVTLDIPMSARFNLERIPGNRFLLSVPPMKFFDVEVNPLVYATVDHTDSAVVIASDEVKLAGSDFVKSLNGLFSTKFRSELSWRDRPNDKVIMAKAEIEMGLNPPPPFNLIPRELQENTANLVFKVTLDQGLMLFLRALADDYKKWATSQPYREQRAAWSAVESEGSSPSQAQLLSSTSSNYALQLMCLCAGSGAIFAMFCFRRSASTTPLPQEPLLSANG